MEMDIKIQSSFPDSRGEAVGVVYLLGAGASRGGQVDNTARSNLFRSSELLPLSLCRKGNTLEGIILAYFCPPRVLFFAVVVSTGIGLKY